MIRRFLYNCPNLKHLRINEDYSTYENVGLLLAWLAEDPNAGPPSPPSPSALPMHVLPEWVPSPAYPHLVEINLGHMKVKPAWVLNVLQKFAPTLERVTLWKVTIQRLLKSPSRTLPKVNFWAQFLEKLRELPLNLRHIKIGSVSQAWLNRTESRVSFDGNITMEYTGPNWTYYVDEMIPKISVSWPQHNEIPMSDSEESESNDDEIFAVVGHTTAYLVYPGQASVFPDAMPPGPLQFPQ